MCQTSFVHLQGEICLCEYFLPFASELYNTVYVLVSCCHCRSCPVPIKSVIEKELNLQHKDLIMMTGYRIAENRFIDKTGLVSQYTVIKVIFL